MARYKEYDYSQGKFIPISFDKQIFTGLHEQYSFSGDWFIVSEHYYDIEYTTEFKSLPFHELLPKHP